MTKLVPTAPHNHSRPLESAMTLANLARELAKGGDVCLPSCARSELPWIEMVAAPYGFDVLFVPSPEQSSNGDVYLQHRRATAG